MEHSGWLCPTYLNWIMHWITANPNFSSMSPSLLSPDAHRFSIETRPDIIKQAKRKCLFNLWLVIRHRRRKKKRNYFHIVPAKWFSHVYAKACRALDAHPSPFRSNEQSRVDWKVYEKSIKTNGVSMYPCRWGWRLTSFFISLLLEFCICPWHSEFRWKCKHHFTSFYDVHERVNLLCSLRSSVYN